MDEQMRTWLDWELKEFAVAMQKFNRKLTKMMYLSMAGSVVGLTVLGFLVGGDAASVFTLHFPIGCVIALIIWICFWIQMKVTSAKKVRTAYEKAIAAFFQSEEDKKAFARQMETKNYGTANFMNTVTDKYPCRFIVGPDYFMFFRDLSCRFIRTADIANIYAEEVKSRIRYHMGDYRVMQNITMGVNLVIEYKADSVSGKKDANDKLYLENGKQLSEALYLIKKYCPDSAEFMRENQKG